MCCQCQPGPCTGCGYSTPNLQWYMSITCSKVKGSTQQRWTSGPKVKRGGVVFRRGQFYRVSVNDTTPYTAEGPNKQEIYKNTTSLLIYFHFSVTDQGFPIESFCDIICFFFIGFVISMLSLIPH